VIATQSELQPGAGLFLATLFAVAAAVIATGFGVWATAPTSARVTPSMSQGIEPFQLMKNANGLATAEFYDHGFVFH
jgi:hypothetical protein